MPFTSSLTASPGDPPRDGGRVSSLTDRWIGWELSERRVVGFDDMPEFDRPFTAVATGEDDEETVRRYLTPQARQGLLDLHFWTPMAGGDGLALLDPQRALARDRDRMGRFEAAIEEALRAAEVLGPPGTRSQGRW